VRAAGIVLAAGAGRRMGGRAKALLPLGATTYLGEIVAGMAAAGLAPGVVVARPGMEAALAAAAPGAQVVINPEADAGGQLSSLWVALEALDNDPAVKGAVVQPVDNPGATAARVAALLAACGQGAAVLAHGGAPGHPVWLPRAMWGAVRQWRGPEGLRGFLAMAGRRLVECPHAEVHRDVDTPADADAVAAPPGGAMT
jgi:nicotine blue oxidoreductase